MRLVSREANSFCREVITLLSATLAVLFSNWPLTELLRALAASSATWFSARSLSTMDSLSAVILTWSSGESTFRSFLKLVNLLSASFSSCLEDFTRSSIKRRVVFCSPRTSSVRRLRKPFTSSWLAFWASSAVLAVTLTCMISVSLKGLVVTRAFKYPS